MIFVTNAVVYPWTMVIHFHITRTTCQKSKKKMSITSQLAITSNTAKSQQLIRGAIIARDLTKFSDNQWNKNLNLTQEKEKNSLKLLTFPTMMSPRSFETLTRLTILEKSLIRIFSLLTTKVIIELISKTANYLRDFIERKENNISKKTK